MVEYNQNYESSLTENLLDATFSAMADNTRRTILARLALGDARVTEIAIDFPISLNAVSKHIKILERSKLITRSVKGRDHILSLNAEAMIDAAEWIEYYRQFWDERLTSLENYVTKQSGSSKKGNDE